MNFSEYMHIIVVYKTFGFFLFVFKYYYFYIEVSFVKLSKYWIIYFLVLNFILYILIIEE